MKATGICPLFGARDDRAQTTGIQPVGWMRGSDYGLAWEIVTDPLGELAGHTMGSYGHGGAIGSQGWIDPNNDLISILMDRAGDGGAESMTNVFLNMAIGIGVNCTAPELISSLIGELAKVTSKPIIVYPNSGEQWDAVHRCWQGDGQLQAFGELAGRWRSAGAQWIGGCCRTGPEHVRAVARVWRG